MNFKLDVVRSAAVASLAVALLASCGGGTQIESFVPRRVIAIGDEASLIEADGRKHTVNGVQFDTTVTPALPRSPVVLECTSNIVWTQQLAYSYGLAFTQCPSTVVNANGVMRAAVNARAADLAAQVDSVIATDGGFSNTDLVTVMAGVNDVIALYESVADPVANAEALVAAVQQAGTEVGSQVVRITDRGAKVIVATIPDMGLSPYAVAEEVAHPGGGRPALLSRLSEQFNTRLRLKLEDVRDGGRAVGLILIDELVLSMSRFPTAYGLTDVSKPVCLDTAPLPACNMTTLDPTAVATSYGYDWLWADDKHLGANAQGRIGSLAMSRARNNPF